MRFCRTKAAPGPRGYPLLGLLHKAWQDPPRFFLDVALRYGEVVRLRLGVHRAYLLSHPEHIKHVLQDNFPNYVKSPPRIEKIKPLFGEGLPVEPKAMMTLQPRHGLLMTLYKRPA